MTKLYLLLVAFSPLVIACSNHEFSKLENKPTTEKYQLIAECGSAKLVIKQDDSAISITELHVQFNGSSKFVITEQELDKINTKTTVSTSGLKPPHLTCSKPTNNNLPMMFLSVNTPIKPTSVTDTHTLM